MGDHFRFGLIFIKKITKPNLKKKKPKPVQIDRFRFGSVFLKKTGSNQFDSVFSVWLCFFQIGFSSIRFGSVFSVSGL
jgi:hypothetical protein